MKHGPRPNRYRDAWCGQLTAERAGTQARVAGWVHRRRDHGGLIFIDLRDRAGLLQLVFHPETAPEAHEAAARAALRGRHLTAVGTVVRREAQNVNPNIATGEIELSVDRARDPRRRRDAAVPGRRGRRGRRGACGCKLPLPRPAPRADAGARSTLRHARGQTMRERPRRARLPRDRDADPDPIDARGRPRLPRAGAHPAGLVLRAAPVAAAVQAAADDRRLRALLPDRPLLPRRGPARRPPARVHPARHRDGVRRRGGRDRHVRGGHGSRVRAQTGFDVRAAAVAADDVRRGRRPIRLRPARHALRARAQRPRCCRGRL